MEENVVRRNIKNQNSLFTAEYRKFCRRELEGQFIEVEKLRRRYLLNISLFISVLITCIVCALLMQEKASVSCWLYIAAAVFAAPVFLKAKEYSIRAEHILFEKLLGFAGEFKAYPYQNIKDEISKLHIFDKYDNFICRKKYKGRHRLIKAEVFDLLLKNGSKTVFNGILIKTPYFKNYTEYAVVKRKEENAALRSDKVSIKDAEFEKYYDVYSDSIIEAGYLLPEAFRALMERYAKKGAAGNISISFEYGNLYIALAAEPDWLRPPLLKTACRMDNYRAAVFELIAVLKTVQALDLEEQIRRKAFQTENKPFYTF